MQKPAMRAGFSSVAGGAEAPALSFAGAGLVRVLQVQPQCVGVEGVDLRLQALEVAGQEILIRDKAALRLNLSATWRFTEVLEAYKKPAEPAEHLYRELQFDLRAAVGTRSLDELLENKTVIDEVVTAALRRERLRHPIQCAAVAC